MSAGAYHHDGTKDQVIYWDAKLTLDIGSPTGADWYYLYLDDTAIVTHGSNQITDTTSPDELLWSTTEPTWDEASHAFMNGDDRCIFVVYVLVTSNEILEFHTLGGDLVLMGTAFADYAAADLAQISLRKQH